MGWLTGLEPETREAFADIERYAQPSDIARAVEHSKAVSMAKANAIMERHGRVMEENTAMLGDLRADLRDHVNNLQTYGLRLNQG